MITLWGRPSSVNVQKVMWALEEMNLPYKHKIVGGIHGGLDRPDFLALTPVARVPVLQDGDLALWESHAIVRHLARSYGAPITADADPWMEYVTSTMQPPFIRLFWHVVRTKPEARDDRLLPGMISAFLKTLDPLEARLSDHNWLASDRFCIGDVAAGALFYRAAALCSPFEGRPGLARWYQKLTERPAYASVVMTSFEELRA